MVSNRRILATALAGITALWLGGTALGIQSASIADLNLPAVSYSHGQQLSAGTLVLAVGNDEPNGFEVTVQSSPFVYSGANSGTNLPASAFTITTADAPTVTSGQAIDPTGGPFAGGTATGTLDVARTVLRAEAGFGNGTYGQELDVQLTIPPMARSGTYTATLTVTIGAAP